MSNSIINRRFKYNNFGAVFILIGINVVLFLINYFLMPSLTYYLSMIPLYVRYNHAYWQFFTYMFMHSGITHILFNMLALLMFGRVVEEAIGSKEFLLYYLLCGTLCGVASYFVYLLTGQYTVILLGASGAIYSLMILFATLYPTATVYVFGIIPLKAPILIVVYLLMDFIGQFRQDGVAHFVHLFGLLFGFLYILIRMKINPLRSWGLIK